MSEPSQHAIDCRRDIHNTVHDSAATQKTSEEQRIQQAIDSATHNLRAFIAEQDSLLQEQTNRADKAERENEELRSLNQLARTLMHKEKERAEKAEAACAEKDEALRYLIDKHDLEGTEIEQALASTCGRNHVSMEDVRPLLEGNMAGCFCHHCQPIKDFLARHGDKLTAQPN